MENGKRPWGEYFVLEDAHTHKVKRIIVNPKARLSLQYHKHRSEVWTIVKGIADITLNDSIFRAHEGDVIEIPVGAKHRIHNTGSVPLIFVEVQLGTYFGEDDIIRIEDDYDRISSE